MLSRRTFVTSSVLLAGAGRSALARPPAGRYVGDLVLGPMPDGRLMRVQQRFGYVDSANAQWIVPPRAVVDGASIPRILWPVIGGPWEGRYREAAVVHDWFCAVRIMPWRRTHRMFYDAMLTSAVPARTARIMFLAVRYAGPSWDDLTLRNARILSDNGLQRLDPPGQQSATHGFATDAEADDARDALLGEFRQLSARVDSGDLSVDDIEQLVDENGRQENTAALLG